MSIVKELCMGKQICEIPVNVATFNGDPCPNVQKAFAGIYISYNMYAYIFFGFVLFFFVLFGG